MANGGKSTSSLTLREQLRLANILSRLASPYAGERAAAALLANAFMERHGLTWFDLAVVHRPQSGRAPEQEKPRQDRRHGPGRPWRGYCRRRRPVSAPILNCFA